MLAVALPAEDLALAALELRHEPAGYTDPEVDRLHADGSYLRTVRMLRGPATIYRDDGVEKPIPDEQTLLMTAMGRARAMRVPCTLHRRPGAGPARSLIVCSFEPRSTLPALPNRCRLVAQAASCSAIDPAADL